MLRSKSFPSMKVNCRGQQITEATWECESDMRNRYPHLFTDQGIFLSPLEDERFF